MDMIQRIIDLRTDNDDSQRDLARKMGINHVQLADYERRKHEMPIKYLVQICAIYKVSADYLLGLPKGLNWPR